MRWIVDCREAAAGGVAKPELPAIFGDDAPPFQATPSMRHQPSGLALGRGADTGGNPRRARISQFELFELVLLSKLIRQTVPCGAIRGNSISVNSTLPPS